MNIKDTVILLIFLLSILGLIIGVYYSEEINNDNSHETSYKKSYEDHEGILTITLEKKEEKNDLSRFFT